MQSSLNRIPATAPPDAYKQVLLSHSPTIENIKTYWNAIISNEAIGLVTVRELLDHFIDFYAATSSIQSTDEQKMEVLEFLLNLLKTGRSVAFEEQISKIRETLSTIYENNELWTQAAQTLTQIPLDSGHRLVPDSYKLKIYIKTAGLFLEDEDDISAEAYLNRAGLIIGGNKDEQTALLFKSCQARILDFKRQFYQASQKYLALSYAEAIAESEKLDALTAAVICAILSPAGPQRSRMLSTLYKDDRVKESPSLRPHYSVLEKMFNEKILRKSEVEYFKENCLSSHQVAVKTADGSTVLEKAVMEHNILSTTKIYLNITIEQLSLLIDQTPQQTERVASKMIEQGRMKGSIDQVDGLIRFDDGVGGLMGSWDKQIEGICRDVDGVIEKIGGIVV